jgi:hypothetical protein
MKRRCTGTLNETVPKALDSGREPRVTNNGVNLEASLAWTRSLPRGQAWAVPPRWLLSCRLPPALCRSPLLAILRSASLARLLERLTLPGAGSGHGGNSQLAELRNCSGRLAARACRTARLIQFGHSEFSSMLGVGRAPRSLVGPLMPRKHDRMPTHAATMRCSQLDTRSHRQPRSDAVLCLSIALGTGCP